MAKKKKSGDIAYPAVSVKWIDSSSYHGWLLRSELETGKMDDGHICVSRGFLLRETKKSFVISSTVATDSGDGSVCFDCPLSIPKVAVLSVRRKKKGAKK